MNALRLALRLARDLALWVGNTVLWGTVSAVRWLFRCAPILSWAVVWGVVLACLGFALGQSTGFVSAGSGTNGGWVFAIFGGVVGVLAMTSLGLAVRQRRLNKGKNR